MTKNEIKKYILEVLENRFNIPKDKLDIKYLKLPLTGEHFQLSGYKLGELIFEIEKFTNKKLDLNSLAMYELAFIDRIACLYSCDS